MLQSTEHLLTSSSFISGELIITYCTHSISHTHIGTHLMKTNISEAFSTSTLPKRQTHKDPSFNLKDNQWERLQIVSACRHSDEKLHHVWIFSRKKAQTSKHGPIKYKTIRKVAVFLASWWSWPEAELTLGDYSERPKLGHQTVNYTHRYISASLLLSTEIQKTRYYVDTLTDTWDTQKPKLSSSSSTTSPFFS